LSGFSGANSRTQGPLDFAPYNIRIVSWIVRSVVVITAICTFAYYFLTFI